MAEPASAWGPPPAPGSGTAAGPPPPAPPGRAGPWLLAVGATVIALALVAGAGVAGVQLWRSGQERMREEAAAAWQAEVAGRIAAENRPELRNVTPVSVLGPTWEPGADTYTMAFPHWPYAFRAPRSWNCLKGSHAPIPDAEAWGCTEGMDFDTPPRVSVLLWECPSTCTEAERQEMVDAWLEEPGQAVHLEHQPTTYAETEENDNGHYEVDLSHFAADPDDPDDPDGPLRWHIGVHVEAADEETREVVLKILNDLISQTL